MPRKEADRPTSLKDMNAGAGRRTGSKNWMLAGVATVVIAVSLLARGVVSGAEAEARSPQSAGGSHRVEPALATLPEGGPQHDVMAIVNGQDISRQTLARACTERHGEGVLESLVNKKLIEHHCRKRGVSVTDAEIEAEIDRMAKRFKLGREQWLELLQQQRGVTAGEYRRDILWPTLALRKLASDEIAATDQELREAYETRYGPSVRARLIVVSDSQLAAELRREAAARPAEFPRLAMQHSQDVNSASIGGLIQPIHRHVGDPKIEQAAFALKPGEISDVISLGKQHVILKCEGRVPPRNIALEEVRGELEESICEEKLRGVANGLFAKLQKSAVIKNVYNDPRLRGTMPGVVATVNGDKITMKELGQECLTRHGEEVLEIEISHLLLKQELKKASLAVAQNDLESEMRHAADLAGFVGPDGAYDRDAWVKAATTEQGLDYEQYLRDSVWPSAALKKLTSGRVEVTAEDLKKGFEANYGERVRCRAIVLGELRRAQEVWEKARENPTVEFFGDLAEQYSIEPTSRSLRGETPPIRRNSGQPQLEQAAFALAEGEMSGITQVGDKFVILKCEGRTEPLDIQMQEVRELLERDIFEKKLRLAMGNEFARLRDKSRIDNYLAGTSHAPAGKAKAQAGRRRDSAVRPTAGRR